MFSGHNAPGTSWRNEVLTNQTRWVWRLSRCSYRWNEWFIGGISVPMAKKELMISFRRRPNQSVARRNCPVNWAIKWWIVRKEAIIFSFPSNSRHFDQNQNILIGLWQNLLVWLMFIMDNQEVYLSNIFDTQRHIFPCNLSQEGRLKPNSCCKANTTPGPQHQPLLLLDRSLLTIQNFLL